MLDDLIQKALGDKLGAWTKLVTDKAGFSAEQAKGFVPAAIEKITSLVKGGKLDLAGLDVQKLLGQLDPTALGKRLGIDASKATAGLKAFLPEVVKLLQSKAGDAKGLVKGAQDMLGKLGKLGG